MKEKEVVKMENMKIKMRRQDREVTDNEKIKALLELMKHNTGKTEWEFDERMVKAVCVFKLEVEEMSCKEHE